MLSAVKLLVRNKNVSPAMAIRNFLRPQLRSDITSEHVSVSKGRLSDVSTRGFCSNSLSCPVHSNTSVPSFSHLSTSWTTECFILGHADSDPAVRFRTLGYTCSRDFRIFSSQLHCLINLFANKMELEFRHHNCSQTHAEHVQGWWSLSYFRQASLTNLVSGLLRLAALYHGSANFKVSVDMCAFHARSRSPHLLVSSSPSFRRLRWTRAPLEGLTSTRESAVTCSLSPRSFMMLLHTRLRPLSTGTLEGISLNFQGSYDVFSHVTSRNRLSSRSFLSPRALSVSRIHGLCTSSFKVCVILVRDRRHAPLRHCHFLNLMSSMVGLFSCHLSTCVSILPVISHLAMRHPPARARNTSTTSTGTPTAIRAVGIDRESAGPTRQRRTVVTIRDAPK